jgi:hypothetical protein
MKTKIPKPDQLRFLSHLQIDEIFDQVSDENPNWDITQVIMHSFAQGKAHQHKNDLETQRLQRLLEAKNPDMFEGLGLDLETTETAVLANKI